MVKRDKEIVVEKKVEIIKAICPSCGKAVATHRCNLCGAEKTVNQVSGNEIWMRNGRDCGCF
jgi:ribosomal protein L32